MTHTFLITYINKEITIARYRDGEFHVLKYKGEKVQEYEKDFFWEWFKQKIEYKDEPLSFVIISDQNFFLLPELTIAKEHGFAKDREMQSRLRELASLDKLLYIPQIQSISEEVKKPKQKKQLKPTQKTEKKERTLQSQNENVSEFFRKKTREYNNEKR